MNPVTQALLERRSTRHYTADPVSREELDIILQAGLWAPTARNAQEIKLVVMEDPELREAFKADFEQHDDRPRFRNFDYGAPVFIFLYGDRDFPYTELDSGITVENMAIAAEGLGLGTVIIGCIRDFMRSEAGKPWREKLGMTEQDLFTIGLCVGHIAQPTKKQDRKENRLKFL